MSKEKSGEAQILEAVQEVLGGDPSCFSVIVRHYQRSVYRLCLSHCESEDDAMDTVQEIFLRIFRSLSTYKIDKKFNPWLYSIVLNQLKTRYGKTSRFKLLHEKLRSDYSEPSFNPEQEVLSSLEKERIAAAVKTLPVNIRQPVLLYYFEDMSVTEIGEVLGIGRENVKSRLHRARKSLRELLGDKEDGEQP
jgi:RNA polymerase sigma-70 factor, ECF subfamily